MADYHVRRSRLSSSGSGSDDFEDESLDPRIQVELEKLNKASEEINRLELELDDARASFRQTLSESTQKLDVLAKKLGSCLEKARPYYDARVKAKEAHLETQRAALRFERACSMHEAAKEMVQLAEQGYMRREQASDPAWQEMLNHATMKVNEAEKERNESEEEHQRTMIRFKVAEDQVQSLQKDLKRAITKSKPYFEMKAKFNQIMEEHKHKVSVLEEDVSSAKSLYSTALRSLEAISDEIHRQRLERRQQQQLGVRGAGVGAECPLPPPSWEKGLSIDGRDALHTGNCQGLDPLGVLKVSSTISYGGASVSRQRSRNLSGESCHGNEIVEEESLHRAKEPPAVIGVSSQDNVVDIDAAAPKEQTPVAGGSEEGQQDGGGSGSGSGSGSSPRDKQGVLIPGDPLGVLPPTYTSLSDTRLASPSRSSGGASISHPAFTGSLPPRSASHTSNVAHPLVTRAGFSHVKASAVSRSKSATSTPEAFVPPSVVYANPEEARRPSYRRAVAASQRDAEEFELPENLDAPELDEVYMSLPCAEGRSRSVREVVVESRQRSYSNPAQPSDLKARSPPRAIPSRISSAVQEALADGRRHSSAPERSATLTSYTQHALSEHGSQEGSPVNGSPSSARRTHKLQGLILRIDPTMDPLRDFEPRVRSQTAPPAPSQGNPSVTSPPAAAASQPEPHTPTPTPTPTQSAPNLPGKKAQDEGESAADSKADCSVSKPIIRSASTISTAGSERSETEFSEVESVSATQSPTKPRSRLLHVPASGECVEDSSDTESLASTGPMLDDEQVEFLTMDFSDASISQEREDYSSATLPSHLTRNSWSRMSLPPRLSYLEGFISRAKRLSGDFDSVPDFPESPTEEEAEEGSLSENIKGFMGSEHRGSSYKEGCSSQARSLPREFDASAPPSMVESPTEQDEGETSAAGEPKGLCKNGDQFQSGHNEDHTRDQDKETECREVLKDNGAETKVESFVVRL